MSVRTIEDIVRHHLWCGCGACAYIASGRFAMFDSVDCGRRPRLVGEGPASAEEKEAVGVCPGLHLSHSFDRRKPGLLTSLGAGWGPVREIWEGYAADPEIRHRGSSGGVATAIARFGIERGGMAGVLQTRARDDAPHLNATVLNTTVEGILEAAGIPLLSRKSLRGTGPGRTGTGTVRVRRKAVRCRRDRDGTGSSPRSGRQDRPHREHFLRGNAVLAGDREDAPGRGNIRSLLAHQPPLPGDGVAGDDAGELSRRGGGRGARALLRRGVGAAAGVPALEVLPVHRPYRGVR